MSVTTYEHKQHNPEIPAQRETFNVVREDASHGTIIEKITIAQTESGEVMYGKDLRREAESHAQGTKPSIESPMGADVIVTNPVIPNRYTYLELLADSAKCYNIIKSGDAFVANMAQQILFEKLTLDLLPGSQKLLALRGRVQDVRSGGDGGGIEYQELDPKMIEALSLFDGCRQAALDVDPEVIIRERRKKGLVASVLDYLK